ncbi:MAG: ABC transporter permease [Cytophagales bacterium]|nr:ABC transporter permease [Cytophagales bacterium]
MIFKSAIRSLQKRKVNTLLSIIVLSIGFGTFIIISLFIKYELSWDKFNENYANIYRIQTYKTAVDELIMHSSAAISENLKNNQYDDILNQSLVLPDWEVYLSTSDEGAFIREKGQCADQNFLEIFYCDFVAGSMQNALTEPFSIILSESLADNLFNHENPIDKTLILDKKYALKITGVYRDLPKNTHLQPGFIVSINTLKSLWSNPDLFDDWGGTFYYTYILTKEDANIKQLGASLKDLMKNKLESAEIQLLLRPLSDLYMFSISNNYTIVLYLFGIFSVMVLILASINFINLSIASGSLRGKEIGIKKVIGANRGQLVLQIFLENFIVTIVSLLISILLIELLLNAFNTLTDKQISLALLFEDQFYFTVFTTIMIVSFLSSTYLSGLITSVNALDLFKQKFFSKRSPQLSLKKFLVGFQFTISICLITVSILMSRQIQHMYNLDPGFEKNQLIFVEMVPTAPNIRFNSIKHQCLSNPDILSVSASRGFPIHSSRYTSAPLINWEGAPREELVEARSFWVSRDFVKTLEMKMVKGRNFSESSPSDFGKTCIINETAARHFGWEDPIGKYIQDKRLRVVGVFKDILFHDPYNQIKPLVLTVVDDNATLSGPMFLGFRIKAGTYKSAKETIENTLKSSFPEDPFVVKRFETHYVNDPHFKTFHSLNNLFILFSVVGILLSVFGMIGLVNHSLTQRTKEIAIRKVSGSSSLLIFRSLMIEHITILFIGAFFGSFAAKYIFGELPIYHPFEQHIFDYLIGVMIALIISFLAIFFKTFKESVRNPVEALRFE